MPDYFDPKVIGRIKKLELRSLRLVESFMTGQHKSRLLGISTEFAQHRPYVPGDDVRHLDWKVYAKTDRYHIKQFEAETNMQVTFLLDTSRSMFFRGEQAAMTKFDYAATTVAALAYLLLQEKDLFSLMLFDRELHLVLRPRGAAGHFRNVVAAMEAVRPGPLTAIVPAISAVVGRLARRGLVVIVSDFVDEVSNLALALGQLSFCGQDVVLMHVEDPAEREFPFAGQTIFEGLEQEGELLCEPRDLRQAYLAGRQRHIEGIQQACLQFGYDLERLQTDKRLDAALAGFLTLRQARRVVR